ncbi:hypothetical protein [Gorillibacterium timonense]|uniref:hypothetical protein n=1 Tax=Gorillibacterium timonense TaxID=1689269 RepID=UPI00071CAC47|nr:hypothetical protein [Gorillibacterium timonense]
MDHLPHTGNDSGETQREESLGSIPKEVLLQATRYLREAHDLDAILTTAERLPTWVARNRLVLAGHLAEDREKTVTLDIDLTKGKVLDAGVPEGSSRLTDSEMPKEPSGLV